MEIDLHSGRYSQEGASLEDVYEYEFLDNAPINLGGQLTSFNGAEVMGAEDGSGDVTHGYNMGKPKE